MFGTETDARRLDGATPGPGGRVVVAERGG